ncbi:hypothetical protein QFZ75_001233 [Streptomyces sp. V3I8]|nr:hypothetical protein [Streptomyces sp. V3I8]
MAQDGGGDASAARAGEQAGIGIGAGGQDALGDEGTDLLDDGNLAGAFAFGALVGQSAGRGCGLTPYGPDPLAGVDVTDTCLCGFAPLYGSDLLVDARASPIAPRLLLRAARADRGRRGSEVPVVRVRRRGW